MNYRALEDLINILVKKAGYELDENTTLEDIDLLTKRNGFLENKYDELKDKVSKDEYFDKDKKNKDLEEKKYLEDSLELIKNQNEGDLTDSELSSLEEQIKFAGLKIDNKDYKDKQREELDKIKLDKLNEESNRTLNIIEEKRKKASLLGLEILDAFKSNKSFKDIKDTFDLLVKEATDSYTLTVDEIENANIFELMDEYSKKKNDIFKKLEKNVYNDKKTKDVLNRRIKYHSDRISSLKDTLDAIEKRKDELQLLIDESKQLYNSTLNERRHKENELEDYTNKLEKLVNLEVYNNDFTKYLDYLREEVLKNKFLEDKYNSDILSYKNEIRNLEINNKNVNTMILEEEKCIEIINDKLEQLEENNSEKINDEITYLTLSERLENLSNEQQYFYVNIDVIKNEVINLWKKGNDVIEIKTDNEETENNSMYEEPEVEEETSPEETAEVMPEIENIESSEETENVFEEIEETPEIDLESNVEETKESEEDASSEGTEETPKISEETVELFDTL